MDYFMNKYTNTDMGLLKIELYSLFFKKPLQLKNKFIDLLPNFDFNDKNYTNS